MEQEFKTIEEIQQHNDLIRIWLLSQRLENYGYDVKEFNKLKSRKAFLIRKLKKNYLILSKKKFYGIYNRLYHYKKDNKTYIGYTTGQSFNEELITLLECFTDSLKD